METQVGAARCPWEGEEQTQQTHSDACHATVRRDLYVGVPHSNVGGQGGVTAQGEGPSLTQKQSAQGTGALYTVSYLQWHLRQFLLPLQSALG